MTRSVLNGNESELASDGNVKRLKTEEGCVPVDVDSNCTQRVGVVVANRIGSKRHHKSNVEPILQQSKPTSTLSPQIYGSPTLPPSLTSLPANYSPLSVLEPNLRATYDETPLSSINVNEPRDELFELNNFEGECRIFF